MLHIWLQKLCKLFQGVFNCLFREIHDQEVHSLQTLSVCFTVYTGFQYSRWKNQIRLLIFFSERITNIYQIYATARPKSYQPKAVNYQILITNYQLSTTRYHLPAINYQRTTIYYQLPAINYQLSTNINFQLSTPNKSTILYQISTALSAVTCQLSTINYQLSTIYYQLSTTFILCSLQ